MNDDSPHDGDSTNDQHDPSPGGTRTAPGGSSLPPPTPPGPADQPQTGQRRLYRDPDGPIAGVATGIARYFGIDPTIVQVIFVVMAFAGGFGVLVYLALWLLLPRVDSNGFLVRPEGWQTVVGAVIIAMMLFSGGFAIGMPGIGGVSIALIVIGVLLLSQREGAANDLVGQARESLSGVTQHNRSVARGFRPQPAESNIASSPQYQSQYQSQYRPQHRPQHRPGEAAPATPAGPSDEQPLYQTSASRTDDGSSAWNTNYPRGARVGAPDGGDVSGYGSSYGSPYGSYGWATPVVTSYPREQLPPAPPRPPITALTLALAVVATGVVLAFGLTGSVAPVAAWGMFALVCGAGLIISAFTGRGAWLLLLPASIALMGMSYYAVDAQVDLPFSNYNWSVGSTNNVVDQQEDLAPTYAIGIGQMNLDLTHMTLTKDATIAVNVGVGDGTVLVPEDMNVVIHATVGQGALDWFGEETSAVRTEVDLTHKGAGASEGSPKLIINAHVGTGSLSVTNG